MSGVRTIEVADVTADTAAALKAARSRSITLCFPCRDEAGTIGELVTAARRALVERVPLLDELVVLDDRSTDDTAAVASSAGARVIDISGIHERHGVGHGKGNALWAALQSTSGDLIVFCDGDVTSFRPDWVARLVWPLLDDDTVHLVKATYERPTTLGGGGRTTELVARPLLSLYAPALAGVAQPLSGEFAGRRASLESIPFVEGWGVEIAMLIDIAAAHGASAISQVDLGVRHHRHRSLHSLSIQAAEVMATALSRLEPKLEQVASTLTRADGSVVPLHLTERPPVRSTAMRHG